MKNSITISQDLYSVLAGIKADFLKEDPPISLTFDEAIVVAIYRAGNKYGTPAAIEGLLAQRPRLKEILQA